MLVDDTPDNLRQLGAGSLDRMFREITQGGKPAPAPEPDA